MDSSVNNDVIGIGGVFALTGFLFLLRHFFLSIGREKSRRVTPASPRANTESNRHSAADDGWLLWTPDHETEVRVDDGQSQEPRARGTEKGTPLR
jgi:hypothetical protein